ncbi:MAG: uroporphyrinogen-III synthase, partial [Planktomarina sp.]
TQAAQMRGFDAVCLGRNVQELIAHWPDLTGQIVYFRGAHVTTDLAKALGGRANLKNVTLYAQNTIPLTPAAMAFLQREQNVVLPLFSARSAKVLLPQTKAPDAHIAVCISEKVAAVCKEYGITRVHVAQAPNAAAMVQLTKHIALSGHIESQNAQD